MLILSNLTLLLVDYWFFTVLLFCKHTHKYQWKHPHMFVCLFLHKENTSFEVEKRQQQRRKKRAHEWRRQQQQQQQFETSSNESCNTHKIDEPLSQMLLLLACITQHGAHNNNNNVGWNEGTNYSKFTEEMCESRCFLDNGGDGGNSSWHATTINVWAFIVLVNLLSALFFLFTFVYA